MKLKKFIFWAVFALLAYNFFGYVKVHTSGDVTAYKRFAKALMNEDSYLARITCVQPEYVREVMKSQAKRSEVFNGFNIILTYYVIKDQKLSADGTHSYIVAEQVSRVNPPGVTTIRGEHEVRIRHVVELENQDGNWLISKFEDQAMRP